MGNKPRRRKTTRTTKKAPKARAGTLVLRLGACLTSPTKRFYVDLDDIALECRRARNYVVQSWIQARKDNPNVERQQACDVDGVPLFDDKGKPVLETAHCSNALRRSLYHGARTVAPRTASPLVATATREVLQALNYRLPFTDRRKDGPDRVWQAILANDKQAPTYKQDEIPVPWAVMRLAYCGELRGAKTPSLKLAEMSKSACLLEFALFSENAGRKFNRPIVRLEARQLTHGNRKLLRDIASGEIESSDSCLHKGDDGWSLHLSFKPRSRDLNLNKANVATLKPLLGKEGQCGFEITTEGQFARRWTVGRFAAYSACVDRLRRRRAELELRYKRGGGHGRGRKRFFEKWKPYTPRGPQLQKTYIGETVKEVIRFCRKFDCGTVHYLEPSVPKRAQTVLTQQGIELTWDRFSSALSFKLGGLCIALEKMPWRDPKKKKGGSDSKTAQSASVRS